jgi:hypothetical protein
MDSPRARGRQADAEAACVLRVSARGKRSRLFMSNLDESDRVLSLTKRFEDSVDPVAREPEDCVDMPRDQTLDQEIGYGFCHECTSLQLVIC